MRRFGKGLTVVRSDQCPYIDDATKVAMDMAKAHGLKTRIVELKTCEEVRKRAPSPYGVYSIVLDGKLLSYHCMGPDDLAFLLHEAFRRERRAAQEGRTRRNLHVRRAAKARKVRA